VESEIVLRVGMVCFFDPDTYPGVYNSCNILAEQGWQVDVVCLEQSGFGGKIFDPRVRLAEAYAGPWAVR
jgi:hypothetical protein